MNQAQHDDLAALFAQRMNFASVEQQQQQQQPIFESVPQQQQQCSEKQAKQPIHFISSHYSHTHHIRPDQSSDASGSPPPPYREDLVPEAMAQTLRDHSIDPASLLPNQIHLFVTADYEQRLRLLELWRIAPPSYPLEQHLNGSLQPTSLEQEEFQARERYENQMQERQQPQRKQVEFDSHIEPGPLSPIRAVDEPAWPPAARMRAASIATSRPQTRHGIDAAEPYMLNGYQEQPRSASSPSIDPVYAAASGLWQAPSYANAMQQTSQGMEDQYGAYMQIRNHADWEAMNEKIARQSFAHAGGGGDDDEMEL